MTCPACGSLRHDRIYEARRTPVHSVVLLRDRPTAIGYPAGDIRLEVCRRCHLIFNSAFAPERLDYHTDYESTQACSEVFGEFQRDLIRRLVDRHRLRGRRVVEIGCGQGEFLTALCAQGGNHGVGFDPAYRGIEAAADGKVQVRRRLFDTRVGDLDTDFVCCKMTLEHIAAPGAFVRMIRGAIASGRETVVFFQVPDARRILAEGAFWDVYYEHCNYFDARALTSLFQSNGFRVTNCWSEFDDQYLMLEATVGTQTTGKTVLPASTATNAAPGFASRCQRRIDDWRDWLACRRSHRQRVVLWGGGSKAVALLGALGPAADIDCVVDINPRKHGTFLPATGHEVIAPHDLAERRPHSVIVMNPIYLGEVTARLRALDLTPDVHPVTRTA